MAHLADVVIAGVLGAAILAIALMARCLTRHARLITDLRAELTAQKILTLTASLPAAAGAEAEMSDVVPMRARGHLALLAGAESGGGAALGARFRGPRSSRYRSLAVTVTAASVLAGAATVSLAASGPGRQRAEAPQFTAPGTAAQQQPTQVDECDNDTAPRASTPGREPERAVPVPVPRPVLQLPDTAPPPLTPDADGPPLLPVVLLLAS